MKKKKCFLILVFCFFVVIAVSPVSAAEWLGSWAEGYRTVIWGSRVQIGTGPTVALPIEQYAKEWCVERAYFLAKAFAEKYESRGEVFIILNLVDVETPRESHAQAVFLEGGVYWPLGRLDSPSGFETRGTLCGITNFEFGDYKDERVFIRITPQTTQREVIKKLLSLNLSW